MNNKLPKITIGITCYNAAESISAAIESALAQDYPNFEIIVVDDASSDASVKTIKGFKKVTLIQQKKNQGVAAARNALIKAAKGAYIAFFDDDDVSAPNRLSAQYQRLSPYKDRLAACYSARLQKYGDHERRVEGTIGMGAMIPYGTPVARRILIGDTGFYGDVLVGSTATCSMMARIDVFEAAGLFDESLRRSEDTEFAIRLALKGGYFLGIEEALVTQNMTLTAEKNLDEEQRNELTIIEKHKGYLQRIGWYRFSKKWLDIRYAHLKGDRQAFLKLIGALFLRAPVKVVQKLIWSLPARGTRSRYKEWKRDV